MEMRQLTGRAPCHRCKPLCAGLITGVGERTIRAVKAPLHQLCGPNTTTAFPNYMRQKAHDQALNLLSSDTGKYLAQQD